MTQMMIQQFSSKFWWTSNFKCVAKSLILHQVLMGKSVVIFFVPSAVQPSEWKKNVLKVSIIFSAMDDLCQRTAN